MKLACVRLLFVSLLFLVKSQAIGAWLFDGNSGVGGVAGANVCLFILFRVIETLLACFTLVEESETLLTDVFE